MLGAKTVTSLGLLILVLVCAWWTGRFDLTYLAGLDPGTAFAVGLFGSLVGLLFARFWEVGEASAYYFDYSRRQRLRDGELQPPSAASPQMERSGSSEHRS